MADEIKYRNLVQRNEETQARFIPKTFGTDNKGPIDQVREKMKEQYGWLSPYEYYYGSQDDASSEVQRTALMPVFSPQALGLSGENSDLYSDVEAADKDNIPNWFWVDSLSNWCYIKTTFLDASQVVGSSSTLIGNLLKGYVGWSAITGDIFGAVLGEVIIQSAEGNLDEWYTSIPTGIVSDWYDTMEKPAEWAGEISVNYVSDLTSKVFSPISRSTSGITSGIASALGGMAEAARWLNENLSVLTVVGVLTTMIRLFFGNSPADADSEVLIELDQTGGDQKYTLSRNCLSAYVWNGYTRSWMPLKWMIKMYDTYIKRPNRGILKELFFEEDATKLHEIVEKIMNNRDRYLDSIVPGFIRNNQQILEKDETGTIASLVTTYNDACNAWNTNHNDLELVNSIKNLISNVWSGQSSIVRSAFMQTFTFDPGYVEAFTTRSPLNKEQIIATQGWHIPSQKGFRRSRWLENWGMWIPLPSDKCKIKIYSKNTFQLINRPYCSFSGDEQVTRGNIHTNIGHPCFMRGNDDVLWMSYWMRWTSTAEGKSSKQSTLGGLVTTGHTYSQESPSDISDKDIENWNAIIDSMFEKHDEYGFEDWMINGNYGLSYSKFTIDEESPTDVSSFEESELNPEKVPIVNSIDWVPKSQMVLRLSDNTVVNRDDKNSMSHAAKRWV